jgi:hypothetical protein
MSFLRLNDYPEDEQNSAKPVRIRIPLVGLAIVLSLLVGAVAGIVAYRYAATDGKLQTAAPARVSTQPAPVAAQPAPAAPPAPVATPAVTDKPAVRQVTMLINRNIQVTITLDQPIPYDAHRLDHPDRVYVDLHGARLAPELAGKTYFVNNSGVSNIRLGLRQPDTVRVVLDLEKRFDYSVAQQTNPATLVMKLTPSARARSKRRAAHSAAKKTSQGRTGSSSAGRRRSNWRKSRAGTDSVVAARG